MDIPMFPKFYHVVDGRERQRNEVTNVYTRGTIEEFHRLGQARVTDPQVMPHMAFQPRPEHRDTTVEAPGLTLINISASKTPDSVAAIHHTQQAIMRRREEVRVQQRDRARRRDPPATPTRGNAPQRPMQLSEAARGPPPPDFLPKFIRS